MPKIYMQALPEEHYSYVHLRGSPVILSYHENIWCPGFRIEISSSLCKEVSECFLQEAELTYIQESSS
jgi:hypothetical protein